MSDGGKCYDTGLRIRGLEVWAITPHRYRHFSEFLLRLPEVFSTEVYEEGVFCGHPAWYVGFRRPDGSMQQTYGTYRSEEEARHARDTYEGATSARLGCIFTVGYKTENGRWADPTTGQPWGTSWSDYLPLKFDLTREEAAMVLAFREEADTSWRTENQQWLENERRRDEDIAHAVSLDSLPSSILNALAGPLECLECGATYNESGYVESGGMGCKRCNS